MALLFATFAETARGDVRAARAASVQPEAAGDAPEAEEHAVLVIGSAPNALEMRCGACIDSTRMTVVRFNNQRTSQSQRLARLRSEQSGRAGWTLKARRSATCPAGQRNADQSECAAAVQEAAKQLQLEVREFKLVNLSGEVPSGCSYSHVSRSTVYNSNRAGVGNQWYQLACIDDATSSDDDARPSYTMPGSGEYADYVGKRTNYLVVNGWLWDREKLASKAVDPAILIAEPDYTGKFAEVILGTAWRENLLSESWRNHTSDIDGRRNRPQDHGALTMPTSGFVAIMDFLDRPSTSHLYVHGFSFSDAHYYDNERVYSNWHNYTEEKRVVGDLVRQGRVSWLKDKPGCCVE